MRVRSKKKRIGKRRTCIACASSSPLHETIVLRVIAFVLHSNALWGKKNKARKRKRTHYERKGLSQGFIVAYSPVVQRNDGQKDNELAPGLFLFVRPVKMHEDNSYAQAVHSSQ